MASNLVYDAARKAAVAFGKKPKRFVKPGELINIIQQSVVLTDRVAPELFGADQMSPRLVAFHLLINRPKSN
jgi:hypothetical protein